MAQMFRLTPGGSVKFTPRAVSASGEHHQITVAFDPPKLPAGATVTGYEYTVDGGDTWLPLAAPPLVLTGLDDGVTYNVAVRALVAIVGVPTATVTASVPLEVPDAPTGVTVTPGDGSLAVAWTAPVDDGGMTITGWQLSTDAGATWSACGTSPVTVSSLSNGTAYSVKVRAVNGVGVGAASAGVSGTPAAPPAGFVDLFDGSGIDPRWTPVGGTWAQVGGTAVQWSATDGSVNSPWAPATALLATAPAVLDVVWDLFALPGVWKYSTFAIGSNAGFTKTLIVNVSNGNLEVYGLDGGDLWSPGSASTSGATKFRATIDADHVLTVFFWQAGSWHTAVTCSVAGRVGGLFVGPAKIWAADSDAQSWFASVTVTA